MSSAETTSNASVAPTVASSDDSRSRSNLTSSTFRNHSVLNLTAPVLRGIFNASLALSGANSPLPWDAYSGVSTPSSVNHRIGEEENPFDNVDIKPLRSHSSSQDSSNAYDEASSNSPSKLTLPDSNSRQPRRRWPVKRSPAISTEQTNLTAESPVNVNVSLTTFPAGPTLNSDYLIKRLSDLRDRENAVSGISDSEKLTGGVLAKGSLRQNSRQVTFNVNENGHVSGHKALDTHGEFYPNHQGIYLYKCASKFQLIVSSIASNIFRSSVLFACGALYGYFNFLLQASSALSNSSTKFSMPVYQVCTLKSSLKETRTIWFILLSRWICLINQTFIRYVSHESFPYLATWGVCAVVFGFVQVWFNGLWNFIVSTKFVDNSGCDGQRDYFLGYTNTALWKHSSVSRAFNSVNRASNFSGWLANSLPLRSRRLHGLHDSNTEIDESAVKLHYLTVTETCNEDSRIGKRRRMEHGLNITAIDWYNAIRSIGAFVGIIFAVRKLAWTSTIQASLTLSLINPVLWYLLDRTASGFTLSLTVGLFGSAVIMRLNSQSHYSTVNASMYNRENRQFSLLYSPDFVTAWNSGPVNVNARQIWKSASRFTFCATPETLAEAVWISSVLFCTCICFGNISRLTSYRQRQGGKTYHNFTDSKVGGNDSGAVTAESSTKWTKMFRSFRRVEHSAKCEDNMQGKE